MKFAVCLAFLASACTPALRHPAPFGFFNVQCEAVRAVVCVPDADMDAVQCGLVTRAAVDAINSAVGREVLTYGGAIPPVPAAVKRAVDAHQIPVWAEVLPEGVLGLTGVRNRDGSACISAAFVRLAPGILESPIGVQVLTHELTHALGGGHAEPHGFGSIMTPAISDPGASPVLSDGDRAALAQVYGS